MGRASAAAMVCAVEKVYRCGGIREVKTCLLCECTSEGTAVVFRRKQQICTWCEDELAKRGRRFCNTCKSIKPIADMVIDRPMCRNCRIARRSDRSEHNRVWRERNREHVAAYTRAHYAANRERILAYKRAKYHANHEAARERARQSYWRHPETSRRRAARWRAVHRDRYAMYTRIWRTRRKLRILRGEA